MSEIDSKAMNRPQHLTLLKEAESKMSILSHCHGHGNTGPQRRVPRATRACVELGTVLCPSPGPLCEPGQQQQLHPQPGRNSCGIAVSWWSFTRNRWALVAQATPPRSLAPSLPSGTGTRSCSRTAPPALAAQSPSCPALPAGHATPWGQTGAEGAAKDAPTPRNSTLLRPSLESRFIRYRPPQSFPTVRRSVLWRKLRLSCEKEQLKPSSLKNLWNANLDIAVNKWYPHENDKNYVIVGHCYSTKCLFQ